MQTLNANSPGVKLLPDVTSLIETGPIDRACKGVLHGLNGSGKTSLFKDAANSLYVDTEDGTTQLDVKRVRTMDSESFHNAIRALLKAQELPFQTLIIDTIDLAEKYLRDRLLRIHRLDSLEQLPYGKGWHHLREAFERLLADFDKFVARGINVVCIAHSQVKKFQPPMGESGFDRYQLRLYEHNAERLKEWADWVLFLNYETHVVESRSGKPRGVGGRTRVLHTAHSAGWDAKVRVDLPEKLPCQFDAIRPLFGEPRKEDYSSQPAAADTSPSAEDTAPSSSHNAELHDQLLDAIGDMDKEDVRAYLVARKLITEGGWIDSLSDNQARWIVAHAGKFRAQVAKFRTQPF